MVFSPAAATEIDLLCTYFEFAAAYMTQLFSPRSYFFSEKTSLNQEELLSLKVFETVFLA